MTLNHRDDRIRRYAEGELSPFEVKQVERELAGDTGALELAEDLKALAASAKAAGSSPAPEDLHEQARSEVLATLAHTEGTSSRKPVRRRRRWIYAVAAALAAAAWLGAGPSVAKVVEGLKNNVRILLLGREGEVLQDLTTEGRMMVVGDTLHVDLDLDKAQVFGSGASDTVQVMLESSTGEGGPIVFRASISDSFRVKTGSDMRSATGETTLRIWPANSAQVDSHDDTLHQTDHRSQAKRIAEDSTRVRTWGQIKKDTSDQ